MRENHYDLDVHPIPEKDRKEPRLVDSLFFADGTVIIFIGTDDLCT